MILPTYKKPAYNSNKNDYFLDNAAQYGIIYLLVGYFNFEGRWKDELFQNARTCKDERRPVVGYPYPQHDQQRRCR